MTDKQRQRALFIKQVCLTEPERNGEDRETVAGNFTQRFGHAEKLRRLANEYERVQTKKCNEPYPEWETDVQRIKVDVRKAGSFIDLNLREIDFGGFGFALIAQDGLLIYVQ